MTKPYPYPEDEFDVPHDGDIPHGAHRQPRSKWRIVATTALVLVLAAVLGFAAATYVPRWLGLTTSQIADSIGITSAGSESESSSAPTDTQDTSSSDSDEQNSSDTEEETPASDETDPAEEQEEEPADEPAEVDQTIAVRVLNSTRTSGLAGTAAGKLETAGWGDVTADNYSGTSSVSASVVYFKSDEYRDEAEAIAEELGISQTLEVPALVGPVSVILASDYTS